VDFGSNNINTSGRLAHLKTELISYSTSLNAWDGSEEDSGIRQVQPRQHSSMIEPIGKAQTLELQENSIFVSKSDIIDLRNRPSTSTEKESCNRTNSTDKK